MWEVGKSSEDGGETGWWAGRTPAGRSASWSQPASKTRSSLTRSSSAAAVARYGAGDSVGRLIIRERSEWQVSCSYFSMLCEAGKAETKLRSKTRFRS